MKRIYTLVFILAITTCFASAMYLILDYYEEQNAIEVSDNLANMHNSLVVSETTQVTTQPIVTEELELYDIWEDISGDSEEIADDEDVADSKDVEEVIEEEEVVRDPLVMLDSMTPFYNQNQDTVGWLTLGGTKIDYVVCQTTDNEFYLSHDFNKQQSQPGTLFVDYRCNISDYNDLQSSNIIIYGHKQKSGTMFGTLNKYHSNLSFYKEHPTFEFSNLYETYTYKIVGMFVCKTMDTPFATEDEVFDYQNFINFQSDPDGDYSFNSFINNIKVRSEIHTPVNVSPKDKFMILSTCSYECIGARFVVIARRVRAGESTEVDVDKATSNNYMYVEY